VDGVQFAPVDVLPASLQRLLLRNCIINVDPGTGPRGEKGLHLLRNCRHLQASISPPLHYLWCSHASDTGFRLLQSPRCAFDEQVIL
jgi:hypothetical protein